MMEASARTLALLDSEKSWWRTGNRAEYDEEAAQAGAERRDQRAQSLQEQANRAREERIVWSKDEIDRYRPKTAFEWEQQSRSVCLGSCRSPRTTEDVRQQREADSRQETAELRLERRALRRQAVLGAHRHAQLGHDIARRRHRERRLVLERARLTGARQDMVLDPLHFERGTSMVHGRAGGDGESLSLLLSRTGHRRVSTRGQRAGLQDCQ